VVFNVRVKQPRSVAGRIWNRAQDGCALFSVAVIALKLAAVITWSWWWVLAPLWVSATLLTVTLIVALVLLFSRR
jgi:uncharacterized protein (DUF983 family)